MSYSPISFIASNYRDYGGHWLKAYEAGTTTAIAMSNDADGTTLTAKYELNSDGFIVSSGSTIVIPHIDSATTYDLWLFPTEDAANNNDTSSAIRVADGITAASEIEVSNYTSIVFDTIADVITRTLPNGETITLKAGDRITTNDYRSSQRGGGATYLVKTFTQATDDGDVIDGYGNQSIGDGLYIILNENIVDATQFGAAADVDSSSAINAAIAAAYNKGTYVLCPAVKGSYIIDASIVYKQGTKLIGEGFDRRLVASDEKGSCFIRKSDGYPVISMNGTMYGERLRWIALEGISIDGDGHDSDIIDVEQVQNLYINQCQIFNTTQRTCNLRDLFDCVFEENYFQLGGTDGGESSFLIDDSLGTTSYHNNNLTFRRCTWEANKGKPIDIRGKGTGSGNSTIQFMQCKSENLDSNEAILVWEASNITFMDFLIVTRGTVDVLTLESQIRFVDVADITATIDCGHSSGGAVMQNAVYVRDIIRSNITLRPSEANVIDSLSTDYIFNNTDGFIDNRTQLMSGYMGSPTKELMSNPTRYKTLQSQEFDNPDPSSLRLSRNGGSDTNTALELRGSTNGHVYVGKNPDGEFVVGTSADLNGTAMIRVGRDGKQRITSSTSATAGSISGYYEVDFNGSTYKVPYYNPS